MPKRPFPYVNAFQDRHGKTRHYFRRWGCKKVSLPGAWGSPEFQAAYLAALAGETAPKLEIGTSRTVPGSVSAAVVTYLTSIDFGNLAPGTQRNQRFVLDRFRERYGHCR